MPETMNALLKKHTDALWDEVMQMKLGWLERKGLEKRKGTLYALIQKHFGTPYAILAHLNTAKDGAE